MRQSFSYILLITWIFLAFSCKTYYVQQSYSAENISVSKYQAPLDSQVVQAYLPFKKILEEDMNRVISVSGQEMVKSRPESLLTNFLADLLLEEGKHEVQMGDCAFGPDISFYNYKGIRALLPEGEITVSHIFELMPFENEMVFIKLNGKQVKAFLDYAAATDEASFGGVRFSISNKKAKNILVNGKELNQEKEYWIVTNDYVANGGDGFEIFTHHIEYVKTGKKIRDVIISHLEQKHKKGEKLTAKRDGRIKNE